MATSREHAKALKKKLEEAKKATEKAEQEGCEMGMAKTEEALRAEVLEVYRFYWLQVWNEALDQAGVKASFALRKAENVYYPPTICALGSSSSKADSGSKEADIGRDSLATTLPSSNSPPKEAEEPGFTK